VKGKGIYQKGMEEASQNGKESSHSARAVGKNERTLDLPCHCHSTNYLYSSFDPSLTLNLTVPLVLIREDTIQRRFICRRTLISTTVSQLRKCCIPISVVYKGFIPAASNSNHTWGKHLPI